VLGKDFGLSGGCRGSRADQGYARATCTMKKIWFFKIKLDTIILNF